MAIVDVADADAEKLKAATASELSLQKARPIAVVSPMHYKCVLMAQSQIVWAIFSRIAGGLANACA